MAKNLGPKKPSFFRNPHKQFLTHSPANDMAATHDSNVVILDNDDDDDDVCILSVNPILREKGWSSSDPISIESYSEAKDRTFRTRRRAIHINCDDDDVQLISRPCPSKMYEGESSNSKLKKDDECIDNFMCEICADEKPRSEFFRIQGCTHSYCSECMTKYVSSKLQENNTNMACPFVGCSGRLEPQDCRSILPREVFDRWGDVLCEAMILASERFYCPYNDCSALLTYDGDGGQQGAITNSVCPNCWRMFCVKCRVPWHSGITCQTFSKLNKNEREREDIMLMSLAERKKWKRCPNCRVLVEKTAGCLFMKCRCGANFCYKCGSHTPVDHRCRNCKA